MVSYTDVQKRMKLTFEASPSNNLPSQSEVNEYCTSATTIVDALLGSGATTAMKSELYIELACALVKEALNSLAMNAGGQPKYPNPRAAFNTLLEAYKPLKSVKDMGVYNPDYSDVEW